MSGRLADQDARDRIAGDLDATLVVEAAAGTGKTSALVARIVAALAAGRAALDRVVAVTFTEAAAGELKLRLRAAIEEARQDGGRPAMERDRLTAALPQLEEARIGTIHGFCADLLRERPVEAGVDPLFEVAPEDVAALLLDRAFERWFERQLAAPGEGVRRMLRRHRRRDASPRERLRAAATELVRYRDFSAPWRHAPFERSAEIAGLLEDMEALGARAADGDADDYFVRSLAAIGRFAADVRRAEAVRGTRDDDEIEAMLVDEAKERHWKWRGYQRARKGFDKTELFERRASLRRRLDAFLAAAGADLAPRLRDELWPVVDEYETLKARAGVLDFLDLLLQARRLVCRVPAVRHELQRRFTHLFVDEFQDTDPLQAELLLLLAADDPDVDDWRRVRPVPGKLFIVADPKQSIYRFRRADVGLYEEVKGRLLAAGAERVDLRVSFRAVPAIQEAVNAAFEPTFAAGSTSQAAYVPLAPFRADAPAEPAVVALPVPAPYGDFRTIVRWRIEQSLPGVTAAFVAWLVRESGWTVTERTEGETERRVPVEARHVCLLFRRFRSFREDVTHPYVRALEARGLHHVLVGGGSFHLREEVLAIYNALAAIERPEDELALFATLRGPLFACDDGALLAFRERFRSLHPFRRLPDDLPPALAEVGQALALLADLHRRRNRRPIAATIASLLAAVRAHAGLALWPTGEQALANVSRLTDMARRAERHGTTSFRAFVERLEDEAEHGEAGEAPIVEPGTEGVRVMTVHKAKGLEFPVVLLADMTAGDGPAEPSRWVDAERRLCALRLADTLPPELLEHRDDELAREREETRRVLYVAATRARDLLVVPVVGDGPQEGWLAPLDPVVYPPPGLAGSPETHEPPGCPRFGMESVPGRPANVVRPVESVVPGLHRPAAGAHRVVWWDPTLLSGEAEISVGLVQQNLLREDQAPEKSREGERAHAAWQEARGRAGATAGTPSLRTVAATAHAAAGTGEAPDVVLETIAVPAGRPHGTRFGQLVHALLAAVDLDADGATVEGAAALHARLFGAPGDEVRAAVETVVAALAHPLLRRAAAAARAGRLRRETPVALRLDDGTLVEGVVDAAFAEEGDGWTVVDFKTDVELGTRLADYRRQVALYAEAVARATGRPARAVLLRV